MRKTERKMKTGGIGRWKQVDKEIGRRMGKEDEGVETPSNKDGRI